MRRWWGVDEFQRVQCPLRSGRQAHPDRVCGRPHATARARRRNRADESLNQFGAGGIWGEWRASRTPVRCLKSRSLHVVDVLTGRTMREWAVPASIGADRGASDSPVDARPFFTFTPDGLCAASPACLRIGRSSTRCRLSARCCSVADDPWSTGVRGRHLAGWEPGGGRGVERKSAWSTHDASRIAEFSASRVEDLSLALRQVARHRDSPEGTGGTGSWRLATREAR